MRRPEVRAFESSQAHPQRPELIIAPDPDPTTGPAPTGAPHRRTERHHPDQDDNTAENGMVTPAATPRDAFLTHAASESPGAGPASSNGTPHHHAAPDRAAPDQAALSQPAPDRDTLPQAAPDRDTHDQATPDQATPRRAAPDRAGPAVLAPIPGPPDGILDLAALAALDGRLRHRAATLIEAGVRAGRRSAADAHRDRAAAAAASSVATVLWFDALRAEDRVSVTPHTAPLLFAVHEALEQAQEPPGRAGQLTGATGEGRTPSHSHQSGHAAVPADPVEYGPAILVEPGAAGTAAGVAGLAGLAEAADVAGAAGAPASRRPAPSPTRDADPARTDVHRQGRPPRRLATGNVGPSGTVWAALAHRFAGSRFDLTPRGRQICLIDFAELRDPAVWETIADERIAHLGELFWVVLVSGSGLADGWPGGAGATSGWTGTGGVEDPRDAGSLGGAAGPGGIGGPRRAARMFEAAGWQVLTVRHGRRLSALSRAPGGAALMARLDQFTPARYRELLRARGTELRRQLAGPGAAGAGISRLLDTLTDEEILACLRDLGGHDIPLLIDAFDEVAADRPTVLFAYTGDELTPDDDASTTRSDRDLVPEVDVPEIDVAVEPAGRTAGPTPAPVPWTPGALRLARHVGSYLDRAPTEPREAAPVPAHPLRPPPEWTSTQDAFGQLLRDLPDLAPRVAAAVVTISTRSADPVLAGWLTAAAPQPPADPTIRSLPAAAASSPSSAGARDGGARSSGEQDSGERWTAGRHVAGGLSASAFGGVLASLGVAWSRQGLPLLPVGVADEVAAGQVLPSWLAAASGDARSMLAVADTGIDPASRAVAYGGGEGVPAAVAAVWTPAFAQDLVWCLLAGLGALARPGGGSSLIRLSARLVDQRLAALPADPAAQHHRRLLALAGGYRLHEGGPGAVLTLVGIGPVMPEVLAAAVRLRAGLRQDVSVVCLTSPNALFAALQARRGLADGSDALLAEIFPADRRTPMVTVVDGDPRALAFLAGVHGDPISALGSAAPAPGTDPPGPGDAPVPLETIIGAALDLLDETTRS
ncbi:pyruvate dehydrogenase [Frankia sp. AiPa1]|uniref:pyruvate dehydrogenase n=1 Tax=Frankia sp. AiPa1 TaxID=573492 RepID=UPI00202AFC8B|nr:pyruvate dehydrogenase [Frankia sp. AiPa1]MCL9760796.1 pyruvate dehydrogenase [Frankia sp. AiPa1]